ncbi:MAG: hypothetical protein K0S32_3670 [Bacteroidetes bacterium]|nr:hypothetical protein [Bacteroidota bacterium]
MKKVIFSLLLMISLASSAQYGPQWFKGFGLFGALTQSAHYYKNLDQDKRDYDPLNYSSTYSYYYPRNHISREGFNWGAGVFAELSPGDRVRWQTEFEYANKSVKEKELLDPLVGTRSDNFVKNKNTYIQWNNYLKFYNPMGYGSHWYVLAGVRLEYLFKRSISAYSAFAGNFARFWGSGDLALGYEFPITKKFSGFTEYHWNPDVLSHRFDNVRVRNRTFELRVGIMYRPRQRSIDDCNAPRYKGPAY